jgi:hypothetical protein
MGRVSLYGLVVLVIVQLGSAALLVWFRYGTAVSSLSTALGTGDFSQADQDLLLGMSEGEPLIVTIASLSMVDLVCNFLCSLRKHNVSRSVVFATDRHTQSALSKRGVSSIVSRKLFDEVHLHSCDDSLTWVHLLEGNFGDK